MLFGLIGRKRNTDAVEALYARILAASRAPFLYTDFAVPDTLEGRFDSLTLHAILLMRRLRTLPSPADSVSQDLVDILFREVDRSLREIGIGDISVPKKMKIFAKTFYGRAQLFDNALNAADDSALQEVLARNVGRDAQNLAAFTQHVRQVDAKVANCSLDDILSEAALLPDSPITTPYTGQESVGSTTTL
ncbi:ubiquinol-cytochrome C chaperone family protein [Pseudochelatococcus sp. G4_1912]|uniref:ubiquinol-cytochrome C chaperone family protein n=1 Tax=Pseudochelatococcus sp. G4_1912 TaxID=3114288 RepID=UPI0039C73203